MNPAIIHKVAIKKYSPYPSSLVTYIKAEAVKNRYKDLSIST
jgi:hypothetical protein